MLKKRLEAKITKVADARIAEVAKVTDAKIAEIADAKIADAKIAGIAEVAGARIAEIAGARIAETACAKIAEMTDAKIAAIADARIAAIADERLKDIEIALYQMNFALKEVPEFMPMPSKDLQIRVVGGYNADFLESGYYIVKEIDDILHKHGTALADRKTVLEWGCGCGRSLRPLKRVHPHLNLYGTDIDPEAIGWLQENYKSIADFKTNDPYPPMDYPDNKFDLIYSVSVFTHLPEDMQFAWLEDLMRLLQPGGIGLFSIHGPNHYGTFKERIEEAGFYYNDVGALTDGLPEFYRQSFHTADYINREWVKYFEILDIVTLGFGNHQDVVVVRKK